jgi:transaldolase
MSAITRLTELGQSPWYDNLTREHARGGLNELIDLGIVGVTSNPTIFEKAMAAGSDYDDQIAELRAQGLDTKQLYWELVLDDVGRAADLLRPLHDAGLDGFVSIEVDPDIARDTDATIEQAAYLFERLARPNVMVKIPATAECLPAITASLARGININVTLIFSLERYREVIDAFFAGLEERVAAGHDVSELASVASFFVSRVDTETDRRLPDGHALRGCAAVANAKLAYRTFRECFSGDRFGRLSGAGAHVQRPLWASTSTKNPDYSPILYVESLIGPHTVNTLAQPSVEALADLDPALLRPDTVAEDVDGAQRTIESLADAGVDFDDVTATLEREGVEAFATSFHDAIETLDKKAEQLSG